MKTKNTWFKFGGFVIAVMLYTILAFLGAGCPIRLITGIPCAGCGMTRSVVSLIKLDLAAALYYHPLIVLMPFIPVLLLVKKGPLAIKKVRTVLWIIIIAAFIVVYIFRLLILKNSAISLGR